MIKSQQTEPKPSACWSKEPQVPALRVEQGDDAFFLFPYIHLEFARMEIHKEQNILILSFSSHEVRIVGSHLKEIGIAIQRQSVEWIKATSPRYVALARKDAAIIEKIEVTEKSDEGSSNPPDPN